MGTERLITVFLFYVYSISVASAASIDANTSFPVNDANTNRTEQSTGSYNVTNWTPGQLQIQVASFSAPTTLQTPHVISLSPYPNLLTQLASSDFARPGGIVLMNSPNVVLDNSEEITRPTGARTQVTSVQTQQIAFVDHGAEYWTNAVMQIPRWIDISSPAFIYDLQKRFKDLVSAAVQRHQSRRYGFVPGQEPLQYAVNSNEITVQVLNATRRGGTSDVLTTFITWYKGYPMVSEILLQDLRLLNTAEQSAIVGYPVLELKSNAILAKSTATLKFYEFGFLAEAEVEKKNLWIIGAVIGSVLGILLCGWCVLFAYYNTCGRVFQYGWETDSKSAPKAYSSAQQQTNGGRVDKAVQSNQLTDETRNAEEGKRGKVEKISANSNHEQTNVDENEQITRTVGANGDVGVQNQLNGIITTNAGNNGNDGPKSDNTGHVMRQESRNGGHENKLRRELSSPGVLSAVAGSGANGLARTNVVFETNGPSSDIGTPATIPIDGIATPKPNIVAQDAPAVSDCGFPLGQRSGHLEQQRSTDDSSKRSHMSTSNGNDMWTLYPWRPYKAADAASWLATRFAVAHPIPYQSTDPDGTIVMHSKSLSSGKRTTAADMPQAVNTQSLLRLI